MKNEIKYTYHYKIPSLDASGAGTVDSRSAVGSSGRRGRIEIIQIKIRSLR